VTAKVEAIVWLRVRFSYVWVRSRVWKYNAPATPSTHSSSGSDSLGNDSKGNDGPGSNGPGNCQSRKWRSRK